GEDKVGAADVLGLQAFHPDGDAAGEFAQDLAPVADAVALARAANQVDAGGEGGAVLGAQAAGAFGGDRPGGGDGPAALDQAGQQRFPAFRGLVGKDDASDAVFAGDAAAFGKGLAHGAFEEGAVLGTVAVGLGFVLDNLAGFWGEGIRWISGVAKQLVAW